MMLTLFLRTRMDLVRNLRKTPTIRCRWLIFLPTTEESQQLL